MKTAWLRTLVVKEGRGAGGGGEIKEGFFNGETRAFVNANGRNLDRGGGGGTVVTLPEGKGVIPRVGHPPEQGRAAEGNMGGHGHGQVASPGCGHEGGPI